MLYHLIVIFLLIAFFIQSQGCPSNCASCSHNNEPSSVCYACLDGFQLAQSGVCVNEKIVNDCSRYDKMMNCLQCRPSFQLRWNSCQKMFTGCFLFNKFDCEICLPGGYANGDGGCSINYLNCLLINQMGLCSRCQPDYTLLNGKCTYNNRYCLTIDKDTGQCSLCSVNSIMIGSSCIPLTFKSIIDNCYFAIIIDNKTLCQYCKEGYTPYNGSCLIFEQVIKKQNFTAECQNISHFSQNKNSCIKGLRPEISINKCYVVDFATRNCHICEADYILVNNTCQSIRDSFCMVFQNNSSLCRVCKSKFHNKSGYCFENPLFCTNYTDRCTACINNFQLINGRCVDPNCQIMNTVTRLCRTCLVNYRLNSQGICKFIDPNCQEFNASSDCVLCLKNFLLRSSTKICTYQDVNCIIYDDSGACSYCKPLFYYNENVQLCIPLPQNCQKAESSSGRCSQCLSKYVLISNFQCIFIPKIENCNIINREDYSKCFLCSSNYFSNDRGFCQKLPKFCLQYDARANRCLQCSASGVMTNRFKQGVCLDKNCQIFDEEQNCLACLPSYQFDSFGQCVLKMPDSSCRQFMFSICKSCTERYYFNRQFICTPVSPMCNEYDSNSGYCTSCYGGFMLNQEGECIINFYKSLVGSVDILDDYCKTYNQHNFCIECHSGFQAVKASLEMQVGVKCVYSIQKIGNSHCLQADKNSSKCLVCVVRMFVDESGNCKGIDSNCQAYNLTSGACTKCYPGYANMRIQQKMVCMIQQKKDTKCQLSNEVGCIKCYQGFYYSTQLIQCVQVNTLCQTYNVSNGFCLSCFPGYSVSKDGNCSITEEIADNKTAAKPLISGCLQYENKEKCKSCQWGFALINNQCIKKDANCQVFVSQNSLECLKCYGGYKIFSSRKICVLQNMIVQKCAKYSLQAICQKCVSGHILNKNAEGMVPLYSCNIIDQNCDVYSSTLKACEKCIDGTVMQGRICIVPMYGVDPNCMVYAELRCVKCKVGWKLNGHLCSSSDQ